jgi:integrase
MMREAGIEEDLRKLILGHKNDDITDRYTHHPDEMILEAIDKLKGR